MASDLNPYYDLQATRREVEAKRHREHVGGLWEEIGSLTTAYLVARGLRPTDYVLDVGCGALRVGVKLVDYLEPAHYFGVDLSADLLRAGYELELGDYLQKRLPRSHLVQEGDFRFERLPTRRPFDVALAQSLFTHLPLDRLRVCLIRLAAVVAPGGTFFATFFVCPNEEGRDEPVQHFPGGVTTFATRDPYHYHVNEIRLATRGLPWQASEPLEWGHPRDQRMVEIRRLDDRVVAR